MGGDTFLRQRVVFLQFGELAMRNIIYSLPNSRQVTKCLGEKES